MNNKQLSIDDHPADLPNPEKASEAQQTIDYLPNELKRIIGTKPVLSYQDQWSLARSCRSFYQSMHDELMKPKAYDFGVLPLGLLNDPIFRKYPLDYHLLLATLKHYRRMDSTFKLPYFDYLLAWPLVALMGMQEALVELVGKEPKQKDLNGLTPLYFIVLSGDLAFTQDWIRDHYPDFTCNDEPHLLLAAMASGNEALVRFFINDHHYPLNFGIETPSHNETFGWRCLEFGFQSLFCEIVVPNLDRYLHKEYHATYPAYAALYGHWGVYEHLMAQGFASTRELRQILVRAAARDDKNRFMELIKEFEDPRLQGNNDFTDDSEIAESSEDYDLFQKYLTLRNAFVYACKGGQIEIVDYLNGIDLTAIDALSILLSDVPGIRTPFGTSGAEVAALYGQIELIEHFITKYGACDDEYAWFENVYYYATCHGDWDKFMKIINLLRKGNPHDFFKPYHPLNLARICEPLDCAIECGNLYFVQRLTIPGILRRFACSGENGFMKNAEASRNFALVRFVNERIEDGKKDQEIFQLNEAHAIAAKYGEELPEDWQSEELYSDVVKLDEYYKRPPSSNL